MQLDEPEPILLAWSGGKDCAMALQLLRQRDDCAVAGLLATVTEGYDRVSMHGVRRELIRAQAESIGLVLHEVFIPQAASNRIYEERMNAALAGFGAAGIETTAFGDIFLQDVREYRERQMWRIGARTRFPLWGRDTGRLVRDFLDAGFRAVTVCIDSNQLDVSFVGREIDRAFLDDLPAGIDPCGENGEFHSFVFDGPVFRTPVSFSAGEVVRRDSFLFCDLVSEPAGGSGRTLNGNSRKPTTRGRHGGEIDQ